MAKTYRKWKPWFNTWFKEIHIANNTSWKNIIKFKKMTGKVLDHRKFTEEELEMMSYRLTDPLTGLTSAGPKMKAWYDILDKIREVCVKPDGSLEACPDDPEAHGVFRLLYVHQDSLLLLLTTLMLHETTYKGIVDFVYDYSDDNKYTKTQTEKRTKYLAEQGFDVTSAADHFLRNGIAHSSFRIRNDGKIRVSDGKKKLSLARYDASSESPPPGTKDYTRQELINGFEKTQSFMADVLAGVVYWFHVNYGMVRLFDDRFFGSPERDGVREDARREMERSNIRDWASIRDKFEKMLP